jgi:glycosyltransferase involved in cell wall biosynthesis
MRSNKAFLPEIDAYIKYFNNRSPYRAYDSSTLENFDPNEFDVIWEFKGFGGAKKKSYQMLIHEYASLSTGSYPKVKNFLKSKLNQRPDLRIFLNENVRRGFPFNDNVEYCYRDMGIDQIFLDARKESVKKEYDFVYVGAVSKSRGIDTLLKRFSENKPGKICLVGNVDDEIYNEYKDDKDIIFTGVVPYIQVPKIASKAVYGINYIPNKYPFNIQTSTKLLEYLALGLKVISTDYKWVRQFEERSNCSFYKIDEENFTINLLDLDNFNFKINFNSNDYMWDNIIERSGIVSKIINYRTSRSLK